MSEVTRVLSNLEGQYREALEATAKHETTKSISAAVISACKILGRRLLWCKDCRCFGSPSIKSVHRKHSCEWIQV